MKNYLKISFFIIYILTCTTFNGNAQGIKYQEKAIYLYNFAKFTEWPLEVYQQPEFVIGIYGNPDCISTIASKLAGKKIQGVSVNVKKCETITQSKDFQIIFVINITQDDIPVIVENSQKYNIMTVGDDIENFCEQGGVINFTKKHSGYNFEINNSVALKAKILISPQLLALAKIIN